jgi:regulator of protease activity HflC (stomatin/prohibitin superfamily)
MGDYVLIILALFVIFFISKGIYVVRQAETIVIERLGKYHKTLTSGISIVLPIFDQPRRIEWRYVFTGLDGRTIIRRSIETRIDLRETVYDFPRQNVITKDNVLTEINALIYFQVIDPKSVVYEIANLPDAIEKLTQTTLRSVIGGMDLDETLSSRDSINSKLRKILDEASDKWGVKVNRVELQDINPPREIRDAMEKQMRAERDRRANVLEAEGLKAAQILQAEGIKISEVEKAEGFKQAKVLIAAGEAEAKIKIAQAEAEAISLVTKTITASGGNPSNYLVALKYIDAWKEMVSGKDNKVVYIPYEASGVLSSLGGIKNLFNDIKQ